MIRRFNRFELKYVLHVARRDALLQDLLPHLIVDPYGEGTGGAVPAYRVTSLYYDSPDLSCFWSKLDGIKYRRKVRLRIYGDSDAPPSAACCVEIKQRIDRTVQKRRVFTRLAEAYAILEGAPSTFADPLDAAVISEVEYLRAALLLRPACVVSYLRSAYVGGRYDPGLRVTFDSDMSGRAPSHLLDRGAVAHHFFSPEHVILEVKTDDAVPLWLVHTLGRHGCALRRVSKYCLAMAAVDPRCAQDRPQNPSTSLTRA